MATQKTYGLLLVGLAVLLVAGCASQGTVKKLTPADASLLTGQWGGTVNPPGTTGMVPGTLTVKPDGTYATNAGAFSTTGKAEIKDGYVQFSSTSGSGPMVGERTGTATLMDRGTSWGLVGSGYSSLAGPFNFDFSKTK